MINLFARFATVGAIGTAVHYLVLIFLVSLLHVVPSLSAGIGASCGAFVNYCLNRRFSFSGQGNHRKAAPRFIVLAWVGILLNGVLVKVMMIGNLHFLIAQAFTTLLILFFNFIVCKKWIFIKN